MEEEAGAKIEEKAKKDEREIQVTVHKATTSEQVIKDTRKNF